MVEKVTEIVDVRRAGGGRVGVEAAAIAAVVEDDAGVAVVEVRHLLPPGKVVAPGAMGEHDRGRLAGLGAVALVIEAGAGYLREGHAPIVRSTASVRQWLSRRAPMIAA